METVQILSQYKEAGNAIEMFIETVLKVGVQNSFEQTLADSYIDQLNDSQAASVK